MTGTFLDSVVTEIYIDGSWLDISSYVVGDTDADWGILGNTPTSKIASVGGLKINLNNTDGKFSPNSLTMFSGWKRGIPLKITLTFEGTPHIKFKGKIENIGLPYEIDGLSVVPVIVNDWLKIASDYPFALEGIQTNKKVNEAVQLIIDALPIAPSNTNLAVGSETLPTVFDNVSKDGSAYSELSKLALTEFSFAYLNKDRTYGETLTVENRNSRINRSLSSVPKSSSDSQKLKLQSGGYLKLQNGGKLLLNQVSTVNMNYMNSFSATFGENLINKVVVRTNPRRIDTSLQTLFTLSSPISILAGQTLNDIIVYYKNPLGTSERINGTNMQSPVASTDYQMWTNSNGTGTNLTSSLTFTVTYGSGGATYSNITNTSGSNAYITKLNARGYGIYLENSIDSTIIDSVSTLDLGVKELFINQSYQNLTYVGEVIAQSLIDQNSEDKIIINNITFLANLNNDAMLAFLYLDVGSLINLRIEKYSIDTPHFIQSVKFKIRQGGIIEVTWGLIESLSVGITYWQLETVGFGELESTTVLSI